MYDPFATPVPPGTIQTMGQTNPGQQVGRVPNALDRLRGDEGQGANRHPRPNMVGYWRAAQGGPIPNGWEDILTQRFGAQPGFQPWLTQMQGWVAQRPDMDGMSRPEWRGAMQDWRSSAPAMPAWLPQRAWQGFGG